MKKSFPQPYSSKNLFLNSIPQKIQKIFSSTLSLSIPRNEMILSIPHITFVCRLYGAAFALMIIYSSHNIRLQAGAAFALDGNLTLT
jgi:hypothetical protein